MKYDYDLQSFAIAFRMARIKIQDAAEFQYRKLVRNLCNLRTTYQETR